MDECKREWNEMIAAQRLLNRITSAKIVGGAKRNWFDSDAFRLGIVARKVGIDELILKAPPSMRFLQPFAESYSEYEVLIESRYKRSVRIRSSKFIPLFSVVTNFSSFYKLALSFVNHGSHQADCP